MQPGESALVGEVIRYPYSRFSASGARSALNAPSAQSDTE